MKVVSAIYNNTQEWHWNCLSTFIVSAQGISLHNFGVALCSWKGYIEGIHEDISVDIKSWDRCDLANLGKSCFCYLRIIEISELHLECYCALHFLHILFMGFYMKKIKEQENVIVLYRLELRWLSSWGSDRKNILLNQAVKNLQVLVNGIHFDKKRSWSNVE